MPRLPEQPTLVTFTARYITETWQLKWCILQSVMHESHTATNGNMMFHAVANEWNLIITDMVIVTDNAANMLGAVQLEDLTHISCVAHTLNLAAQQALKLNSVYW